MDGRPSSGRTEAAGPHQWRPDGEARDLLADVSKVVPIIGAGVSAAAGLAEGAGLLSALRTELGDPPDGPTPGEDEEFFTAVDMLIGEDFERERKAQDFIASFYEEAVAEADLGRIAFDLVQLPSRLVVTLNYDRSLEAAEEEVGQDCVSLYGGEGIRRFIALAGATQAPELPTILHLHGSVEDPRHLVLARGSYQDLPRRTSSSSLRRWQDAAGCAFSEAACGSPTYCTHWNAPTTNRRASGNILTLGTTTL